MMTRNLALLWLLVLTACANQVAPSGGEKDTTPPTMVKSVPANETVQFNYPAIHFEFDEFIQFQYPNPAFSITPTLPNSPELIIKNKSITIHLPDSLMPNTTYQINFGNSLKDLNEGNEISNFTYVFSTGAYIDSFSLAFSVVHAQTNVPISNAVVGLYPATWSDSMITHQKPIYFKKTDDEGEVLFSYLREDTFQVLAFADKNSDYIFQPATEGVAFSPVYLPTVQEVTLQMLKFNRPSSLEFSLSYQQKGPGQLQVLSSREVMPNNIKIENADTFAVRAHSPDSFSVYFLPISLDSLLLSAISTETDEWLDTIQLRSFPPIDSTFALPLPQYQLRNDSLWIRFNLPLPLLELDSQQATVTIDSQTIRLQPRSIQPLAYVITPAPFGDSILFTLPANHLTNWFSAINKPFSSVYQVPEKNQFGQLTITIDSAIQASDTFYQIQLLDQSGSRLDDCWQCEEWKIPALLPGEYRVRVLLDANNNGYWDKGRFATRQPPEEFIYYPDVVTIRANWENHISLEIK